MSPSDAPPIRTTVILDGFRGPPEVVGGRSVKIPHEYACPKCGGTDLQVSADVNYNPPAEPTLRHGATAKAWCKTWPCQHEDWADYFLVPMYRTQSAWGENGRTR